MLCMDDLCMQTDPDGTHQWTICSRPEKSISDASGGQLSEWPGMNGWSLWCDSMLCSLTSLDLELIVEKYTYYLPLLGTPHLSLGAGSTLTALKQLTIDQLSWVKAFKRPTSSFLIALGEPLYPSNSTMICIQQWIISWEKRCISCLYYKNNQAGTPSKP